MVLASDHELFISYANDSREFAYKLCSYFEDNGIHCWIAPRDIRVGIPYAEQITEAVQSSKLMILILSEKANESPFILSELTSAFNARVRIITVRKEDILPSNSINFYIQNLQWIDIFPPPYESLFAKLLDAVQYILKKYTRTKDEIQKSELKPKFQASPLISTIGKKIKFINNSTGENISFHWDFGDGESSKEKEPVHIYTIPGHFTVKLTLISDTSSITLEKTGYINIRELVTPKASFSAKITKGKAPLKVQFTDQSTGSPSQYSWDFGDGSKSTEKNPQHEYEKAGIFNVSLTVKNDDGSATVTKTGFISVDLPVFPKAAFRGTGIKGKVPLKVQFIDESTGSPTDYEWDFGDGTKSTDKSPGHIYTTAGIYHITLTVRNDDGTDFERKTGFITAEPPLPPKASFSAKGTKGKAPLKVQFIDESTGSPTDYEWDFGDGVKSKDKIPEHLYVKAGTYDVTLIVRNDDGTDFERKTGFITVEPPLLPKASFSAKGTRGKAPLKVHFTDESTGSPTGYGWDFSDGQISSEKNPIHLFSKPGSYDIRLIVMNDSGTDTIVKSDFIKVDPPSLPKAAFTAITTVGKAPLNVQFRDESLGSPVAYIWEFGDGAKSTEKNPGHLYKKAGTYDITLTVKNEDGEDKVIKTGFVQVSEPETIETPLKIQKLLVPALYYIIGIIAVVFIIGVGVTFIGGNSGIPEAPTFTSSPDSGRVPLSVHFTATSPEIPDRWIWDFGDGSTSDLQNPVHLYNDSGNFTATLQVEKDGKISPLESKTIQVFLGSLSTLIAQFTADPMKGKPPLAVQFSDESYGEIVSRLWDFGDGYTSIEKSPLHTYLKPGNYSAVLTITSACCENTTVLPIVVEPVAGPSEGRPVADFIMKKGIVTSYSVFFDGTISRGPDLIYEWSFDDTTVSTSPTPVKFYQGPGTHQVTLKVTNSFGTDSITKRIIISTGGDVTFEV